MKKLTAILCLCLILTSCGSTAQTPDVTGTTDGGSDTVSSAPDETDAPYTGPIAVTGTTVVRAVAEGAGIANLEARNCRAEQLEERFDYVVSRAVTDMATFTGWVWPLVERGRRGTLPNGILYLKGGDLTDELARTRQTWREYPISAFFDEEFFETKKVVYTSR